MKRKQVHQISNSRWFPAILRKCIHEFITWFVTKVNEIKPFIPITFIPLIEEGLQYTNKIVAVNMDVGAGFETVDPFIDKNIERSYINMNNFKADKNGLYIIVNSFHQLNPEKARDVLQAVSERRQPIAVLEGNNDSLWQVFGMTILVPLSVIFTAPFVKPFRLIRLLCTYIVPILPIVTLIDGFLALFMLYAPDDLDELVRDIRVKDYQWRSGKMDNGRGGKIIYLLGYPVNPQ